MIYWDTNFMGTSIGNWNNTGTRGGLCVLCVDEQLREAPACYRLDHQLARSIFLVR